MPEKKGVLADLKARRKGFSGELGSRFGLWMFLGKAYSRVHNLIIKTKGITTQIDHVCLSPFGIFVVETKHFDGGWIYGKEDEKNWTVVYRKGGKHKIKNPLHQNYRHTKAISEVLGVSHDLVHSVIIFFSPERNVKTDLSPCVTDGPRSAAKYIKTFTETVFTAGQVLDFANKLEKLRSGQVSNEEHLENLESRYKQKEICPKCGSAMVERTAKRGENKGNKFLACSAFPKCRYIYKNKET